MIKKAGCFLVLASLLLSLSACWNYRGLNKMTVVAGVAIDKNSENGNYQLSFEIVDYSMPVKESGLRTKILESEGKSLFDAVRNAKKRVDNKLYFGQTQLVIVSKEIAANEGIIDTMDLLLRDGECRETVCVAISQEKTARDIFNIEDNDQGITSMKLCDIIENDKYVTASTLDVELYEIFNTFEAAGKSLVLPAVRNVRNAEKSVGEINGTAVFKDERLIGYLSPDESKYFLYIINEMKGGLLTFSSQGEDRDNATLEVVKNKTKNSFEYENGKLKIFLTTETNVYLDEFMGSLDALDKQQVAALEEAAASKLRNNIIDTIEKVQAEYGSDIFGFGNMIYKNDVQLWNELKDNWDKQFKTLEVEVQTKIHIVNTASNK
ncbi:Spore germination protein B3 [bioreactor metagenome]|uniref:Spore germination protein B3 n=1 Tax=bioreactor metagenome TaxID=1076179 RepID=A0A644X068_9ZZZZ